MLAGGDLRHALQSHSLIVELLVHLELLESLSVNEQVLLGLLRITVDKVKKKVILNLSGFLRLFRLLYQLKQISDIAIAAAETSNL